MATKLLLIEDVESLGRRGEIVSVKPGFSRNYLLPKGFAVIADKQALRQQERLKAERLQQAIADKKEAETVAAKIEGATLIAVVKVDHEGRMYGSVTHNEIVHLLHQQHHFELDKKCIALKHPIKETGAHTIQLKLKEGVLASVHLKVMSEEGYVAYQQELAAEKAK